MKTKIIKITSLFLLVTLLGPLSAVGGTPQPPEITVISANPETTASPSQTLRVWQAAPHTADGRLRLIVELQAPPLGLVAPTQRPQFDVESAASQTYLAEIDRQQEAILAQMTALAPSLQVDFRYRAAFNGFGVRVDPAEAAALLKLEAVKHIYPDQMRTILLDSSPGVIGAPDLWADLGGQNHAGEGMRIAVIDTGIRPENPMFAGNSFIAPPGFPHGYCADFPSDANFQCNDKLIVARYYPPTFAIHPSEVYSPLDIHGHGSHVAGIAAGNAIDVPTGNDIPANTRISGVAPRAYLMVYKAFFTTPEGNVSGSDAMLLAALDDALLDDADVVNNSWGGAAIEDPTDNPFVSAVQALKAAGVVVVFAAGNGGPTPGTIRCPGCLEDVITVGASTADRVFANTLDVTGPGDIPANLMGLAALSGSGPEIAVDLEGEIRFAGTVAPSNSEACAPFSGTVFTNALALIPRGGCPFLDKVQHAQAAGALAVLIYNNEPGFPIKMAYLESTLIPSAFMSQDQGQTLLAWVTSQVLPTARLKAVVSAVHDAVWQDTLWESSSVGPNGLPNVLKPDLVAPGVNILSAVSPVLNGGAQFQLWQGTSMSTPHVSGAAALLRQRHPEWTPQQIKTALTSTAYQNVSQPDGNTPATPFMMGAGRLDLSRARNTELTFSAPSFANGNCLGQCNWADIQIENVSLGFAWRDAYVSAPVGMQVSVEPSSLMLPFGESSSFSISVDVSALPPDQWYFATLRWEPHIADPNLDAYLPIAVYATAPPLAELQKEANHTFASPGDTASYTLTLFNDASLTSTFVLSDTIPQNASYIPGSATGGLVYNSTAHELTATVAISAPQAQIAPDALYGYLSLADRGVAPLACPDINCDEAEIRIPGLDFYFNGRPASDLIWSTNGYLQVASANENLSAPHQNLPDPAAPNNLLAPLWADLIHGVWYYALVRVGETGPFYYVFEWKEAALKSDSNQRYSFQVWIERGTDQIWFVYGPQTAPISTGTVGVENQFGSVGAVYFYNGGGSAPVEGISLKVGIQNNPEVFSYALLLGPEIGDVINLAQAENQNTGRVVQALATVYVGRFIFLPLVLR